MLYRIMEDCCTPKKPKKKPTKKENKKKDPVLYGLLAGFGLLILFLSTITIFQGFQFALLSFRNLWYLVIPLAAGFGTQIGLYTSIKHTASLTGTVSGTGGISAGSMLACCSHFLLNIIPIAGLSGIAVFLMAYQKQFLGVGIIANIVGIGFLIKHKRRMNG